MTSACLPCTHSPFSPPLPKQKKLFIQISSNPDSQQKKPFIQRQGAGHLLSPCFYLSTSAAPETNSEYTAACAYKHTARRPLIPRGPPSGSCLMQWPFVVETIFTSETQNGFINSIRGWHFPHPHAGPENRCNEEYCSLRPPFSLSLSHSLCWQHMHICTSKYRYSRSFGQAPLGHHTFSRHSVQLLSDKPIPWRVFPYGRIPMWLWESGLCSCECYCSAVGWSAISTSLLPRLSHRNVTWCMQP